MEDWEKLLNGKKEYCTTHPKKQAKRLLCGATIDCCESCPSCLNEAVGKMGNCNKSNLLR